MKIVLASENVHKVREFEAFLGGIKLCSLKNISNPITLPPETGQTYRDNAFIKANFVFKSLGLPSLGDDSGFEVEALNNEPGVYSARYLNTSDSQRQCQDILRRLEGASNRRARFVCCLCFIDQQGTKNFFEGVVEGTVSLEMRGNQGFGYDPIFIPDGFGLTFAELSLDQKMSVSHRGRALAALQKSLKT